MGSVLSSAHAALCSFVNAQLYKAEARRLLARFPSLRDLPAEEREDYLRWWLMDEELQERVREDDESPPEAPDRLRRHGPCGYWARRRRRSQPAEAQGHGTEISNDMNNNMLVV